MKNFLILINIISGIVILSSYELYEITITKIPGETELTYGCISIVLLIIVNIALFLKAKKNLIKYELIIINLITTSYLGKIFIKIKYFESLWYDIVYSTNFFNIKRHYNTIEYWKALNEYIDTKYNVDTLFDVNTKAEIIKNSESIQELYSNIDKHANKQQIVFEDLNFTDKLITYCINHPILVVTAIISVIGCAYLTYSNVIKIQQRWTTSQMENELNTNINIVPVETQIVDDIQKNIETLQNKIQTTIETVEQLEKKYVKVENCLEGSIKAHADFVEKANGLKTTLKKIPEFSTKIQDIESRLTYLAACVKEFADQSKERDLEIYKTIRDKALATQHNILLSSTKFQKNLAEVASSLELVQQDALTSLEMSKKLNEMVPQIRTSIDEWIAATKLVAEDVPKVTNDINTCLTEVNSLNNETLDLRNQTKTLTDKIEYIEHSIDTLKELLKSNNFI